MAGVKRDLFRLGEKVVRVAVERHLADAFNGHHLLGNQFGRIE